MDVRSIPVIRAAYLNLILQGLSKPSKNYAKNLKECYLPGSLLECPDAYLPLHAVMSFMRRAADGLSVEDISLRAASRLTIADFSQELRSLLLSTSSLETALRAYTRFAGHEQSGLAFRVIQTHDQVHICSVLDEPRHIAIDPVQEWFAIMSLVTIIRHFVGETWQPDAISFQSKNLPGALAHNVFSDVHFYKEQKQTGLMFPVSLLSAEPDDYRQPRSARLLSGVTRDINNPEIWDFPTCLQQLLRVYIDEGYPDIKLAANIAGCSVRTLQPRLRQCGLSYSNLIHQTQIECAKELLADKKLRTLDVAFAVGYRDSSNFTRAFRRVAGLSPKQYRSQTIAY